MGLVTGTIRFAVVILILYGLALVLDGKFGTLQNMGLGFVNFIQALPQTWQQVLGLLVMFVGILYLPKLMN